MMLMWGLKGSDLKVVSWMWQFESADSNSNWLIQ